jgi:hypothetical protein
MPELLRNSNLSDIRFRSGLGNLRDPEFHIRRLSHFNAGIDMGTGLIRPGSEISHMIGKDLLSYNIDPTKHKNIFSDDTLRFDMREEGLSHPSAILQAAVFPTNMTVGLRKAIQDDAYGSLVYEAAHRKPFSGTVASGDKAMHGSIDKAVFEPSKDSRVLNLDLLSSHWDPHDTDSHFKFLHARDDIYSRFGEFNRKRNANPELSERLSELITNMPESEISSIRQNKPHHLSGQFLGVSHTVNPKTTFHDVVDLETGTWAKLDPRGYFPN